MLLISMLILSKNLVNIIILILLIIYSTIWDSHGSLLGQNTPNNYSKSKTILKKLKIETILKIPGHMGLENVDVWFQHEARFGQQNTTTRLWAARGTRPRAVKQQQFEYAYLFGWICPARGIGEAMAVPWVNKRFINLPPT